MARLKKWTDEPGRDPGRDDHEIYTRRAAMAVEYGFAANAVSVDGFDEAGFYILGTLKKPGVLMKRSGVMLLTFVPWKDRADALRARAAIEADLAETFPDGMPQE